MGQKTITTVNLSQFGMEHNIVTGVAICDNNGVVYADVDTDGKLYINVFVRVTEKMQDSTDDNFFRKYCCLMTHGLVAAINQVEDLADEITTLSIPAIDRTLVRKYEFDREV